MIPSGSPFLAGLACTVTREAAPEGAQVAQQGGVALRHHTNPKARNAGTKNTPSRNPMQKPDSVWFWDACFVDALRGYRTTVLNAKVIFRLRKRLLNASDRKKASRASASTTYQDPSRISPSSCPEPHPA